MLVLRLLNPVLYTKYRFRKARMQNEPQSALPPWKRQHLDWSEAGYLDC